MNRRTMAVAAGVVGVLVLSACSGMTAAAEVAQAPEVGIGIVLVASELAMLPSIIAFLAFQRSFMRGISEGAIK